MVSHQPLRNAQLLRVYSLDMTPCPVASRIMADHDIALQEAYHHREDKALLLRYAGAVASALDHHLAACAFCKEPTMTQHTRCSNCRWVHEADSEQGTSFMGVELCPLHAAAPELLEALRDCLGWIENSDDDGDGFHSTVAQAARAAIKKATGG